MDRRGEPAATAMGPTARARLICDEPTARRLAAFVGEGLDADNIVCAAFEDGGGRWIVELDFRDPPDEAAVRKLIALGAGQAAADALAFDTIESKDWVAASLAALKPVCAGRYVVHGRHDRARVPPNAIGIEIEAALAFGTGHHGTTRGCLLALDAIAKRQRARRILDLGTGTGVLAIAAARMLRSHVLATDIDRLSVSAARANARLNRVGTFVETILADGTKAKRIGERAPYDLVFANILAVPLMRMAASVAPLIANGGHVVLSGLLPADANGVLSIYRAQDLILERELNVDGWATLVMRRAPGVAAGGRRS